MFASLSVSFEFLLFYQEVYLGWADVSQFLVFLTFLVVCGYLIVSNVSAFHLHVFYSICMVSWYAFREMAWLLIFRVFDRIYKSCAVERLIPIIRIHNGGLCCEWGEWSWMVFSLIQIYSLRGQRQMPPKWITLVFWRRNGIVICVVYDSLRRAPSNGACALNQ